MGRTLKQAETSLLKGKLHNLLSPHRPFSCATHKRTASQSPPAAALGPGTITLSVIFMPGKPVVSTVFGMGACLRAYIIGRCPCRQRSAWPALWHYWVLDKPACDSAALRNYACFLSVFVLPAVYFIFQSAGIDCFSWENTPWLVSRHLASPAAGLFGCWENTPTLVRCLSLHRGQF